MRNQLLLTVLAALLISCSSTQTTTAPDGDTGSTAAAGISGGAYAAVEGKWEMTTDFRGAEIDAVMTLSVINGNLSGSWESQGQIMELTDLTLEGDRLTFGRSVGQSELRFDGRLNGNEIVGKYTGGFGDLECSGHRAGATAP